MSVISKKTGFQIRPRFEIDTDLTIDEVHDKFKAILKTDSSPCDGKVRKGYVSLFPKEEDKHYWSPHLSMTIEDDEEDVSHRIIHGLYGPSPAVWTMFVFFYAIIGLFIVIISVIGFANRSIGDSGAILWLVPVLILIFFSLYLVSFFGQKKGHDQIETIHHFLEDVLGQKINGDK